LQLVVQQNFIVSRPIVQELVEKYGEQRKKGSGTGLLPVCEEAINVFSNQHALQEYVNNLRYHVAKVYQKEVSQQEETGDEDKSPYQKAAIHLGKINLEREESSGRTNQEKVKIWLDCARLYLVDELYREAETFVNKCAGLMNSKPMKDTYKLRFWVCSASCTEINLISLVWLLAKITTKSSTKPRPSITVLPKKSSTRRRVLISCPRESSA
jgi:hypothetical protein